MQFQQGLPICVLCLTSCAIDTRYSRLGRIIEMRLILHETSECATVSDAAETHKEATLSCLLLLILQISQENCALIGHIVSKCSFLLDAARGHPMPDVYNARMEDWSEKLMLPEGTKGRSFFRRRRLCITSVCSAIVLVCLGLSMGLLLLLFPHRSESIANVNSYGLPERLGTVTLDRLVNKTQLDLKTGFVISTDANVREYEFNITQAYAAPDGFYKPMILVNG